MFKGLACIVAAVALGMGAGAAHAEGRALLVGVSDYPTLPAGVERTVGARNDVLRMRDVLLQRGFGPERITVLADGLPGAAPPTRANILQALNALAEASAPGDSVVVHFAGHGSLEPPPSGRGEPTPTFLPLDVGRWSGESGTVLNAIRQGELRARVDRIADRGAFVWGLFDACHSAGLVRRAALGTAHRRFVEPADLGVPLGAVEGWQAVTQDQDPGPSVRRGLVQRRSPTTRGGTVFFYAAQAGEAAVEMKLPTGSATARSHGLFTFLVAQMLQEARPMTYRQLSQAILAGYGTVPAAYSTPIFSGDALDRLVLGQDSVPLRQWPLIDGSTLSVEAGLLSGMVPGAVLAVLPRPTAGDAERLGLLRVVSADLARATLAPLEGALPSAPHGGPVGSGRYVRLLRSPLRYALRLAEAPQGCAADCPAAAALNRLRIEGVEGLDLEWVAGAEPSDVVVRHQPGRTELLASTGAVVATIASPQAARSDPGGNARAGDALASHLADRLRALARSRNLLALASRHLAEVPAAGLVTWLGRAGPRRPADEPFPPERAVRVVHGDVLSLSMENRGPVALDITALYLDARFGIAVLFPKNGESNRVAAGSVRRIDDLAITVPPGGLERVLVIAQPAKPGAERSDYSFLAQGAVPRPAALPPGDAQAFADAAFADYRRRGLQQPAMSGGGVVMQVLTIDVRASRTGAGSAPRGEVPR